MRKPLRIGLVAWHALPAILGESARSDTKHTKYDQAFGGLETAMWTLATHMAKLPEIEAHVFVASSSPRFNGKPYPNQVEGVRLHVAVDRFRNLRHHVGELVDLPARRIKKFSPHLLWQLPLLAISRPFRLRDPVDCQPDPNLVGKGIDVWIAFGVTAASSRVVATAKLEGVPSVVCVQSNAGLDPRLATDAEFLSECGESAVSRRFALTHADAVVCQSNWQLERLRSDFGLSGWLMRNPIDRSVWRQPKTSEQSPHVLWIGRYDDFHKRPLLMLEAAKKCPHIPIRMIINHFDSEIETRVKRECPPNVQLVNRVPFEQMPNIFAQARLFASTGSLQLEGFPNVLLQAAATHTPIVALSDHDRFLDRSGAGVGCNESIDEFAMHLNRYWEAIESGESRVNWETVDQYLDEFHNATKIAISFAKSLIGLIGKRPEPPYSSCGSDASATLSGGPSASNA